MQNQLNMEYFEWMYNLVCSDKYNRRISFRKLLYFLHNTEFIVLLKNDSNRALYGLDFRYRFGY